MPQNRKDKWSDYEIGAHHGSSRALYSVFIFLWVSWKARLAYNWKGIIFRLTFGISCEKAKIIAISVIEIIADKTDGNRGYLLTQLIITQRSVAEPLPYQDQEFLYMLTEISVVKVQSARLC